MCTLRQLYLRLPATMATAIFLLGLVSCASTPELNPVKPAQKIAASTPDKALPKGSFEAIFTAETALRRNQLNTALDLFSEQTAITQSPTLATTTALLASFLQNYAAADAAVDIWLKAAPNDTKAHTIKAKNFIQLSRFNDAFDYINAHTDIDQTNLWVTLASTAVETNAAKTTELGELRTRFETTLALSPNNTGLLVGLALLVEHSDTDRALKLIAQASQLAPNSIMIAGITAALYAQNQQLEQALATLQTALKNTPNHYGLRRQLARTLLDQDVVKARSLLQELVEEAPDDPAVRYYLAQANMRLEFYQESRPQLEKLLSFADYKDYAHFSLGLISEQRQEFFIAAHHYQLVGAGYYLLPALQRLERLAYALGDSQGFEQHLSQLKQSAHNNRLDLIVFELEYFLRSQQLERAELSIDLALATYGDNTRLLYGKFLVAERQQRYDIATSALEKVLLQQPDNPVILNALGYTLSRYLGRHQEAKPLIAEALALRPNDASIIDSMGWVLLNLGQIEEALKYLLQAYSRSTNTDIAAHLGEALWLNQQNDEALDVWREAYKNDADNTELLETLKRFDVNFEQ